MGLLGQSRGWIAGSLGCLAWLCVCAAVPIAVCAATHAQPNHHTALSPWQQAVQTRTSFESQDDRTRAAFAPVLDAFRAIYHDDPRDLHAPDAVNAVAQLLAEQGRALSDERSLRSAIGQYEFLREQYPTSSLRWPALLAEAQIDDADLHDPQAAKEKYAELLHDAPRSAAAGEARVALAEEARVTQPVSDAGPPKTGYAHGGGHENPSDPTKTRAAATGAIGSAAGRRFRNELSAAEATPQPGASPAVIAPEASSIEAPQTRTPLALVTGIRHWSTPTYTRVAIDLGGEVTFQAARVPHPDRIYFDLHGAKLAAELTGKTFNVTDDGFLERIRAAQDSPGVTRVVLDVSQVADYSAFLLPNPYRLIIDIHGANAVLATASEPKPEVEAPVAPNAVLKASAAADTSGLPATAPTTLAEANPNTSLPTVETSRSARIQPDHTLAGHAIPPPRTGLTSKATPARPVPNTIATPSPAATAEIAEVSHAPGRIEATPHPTSKPIASAPALRARRVHHQAALLEDDALPARAAARTSDGQTSLTRALGLGIGRIVIDAGHGGHDSGTLGVDGIEEKDVVLDVALRLGKLLHDRLGAEIIYTRSDDTFIPLETRTAIANKAQADLFLSIHANSSSDPTARGVETYYLNFTSDPSALDVAARENAVSGESIHQLSSLVKKIALKDKIDESREFASDVEGSLFSGLEHGNAGLKNRGVKKAPFVVLIGANMPSILAEISFVTNARDADQLRQPDYRERVAESLFRGVEKYERSLAGAPPANLHPDFNADSNPDPRPDPHPDPRVARAAIR